MLTVPLFYCLWGSADKISNFVSNQFEVAVLLRLEFVHCTVISMQGVMSISIDGC